MTEVEPDSVSAVTHATDYVEGGVKDLGYDVQRAVRFKGMVSLHLKKLQEIEDIAWTLYSETIDTASGIRLDFLGEIIGEPRGELFLDSLYRPVLKAASRAGRSDGSFEDLIAIVTLFRPGESVHVTGYPHASVVVDPLSEISFSEQLLRLLNRAVSAGVRLQLTVSGLGPWFTFAPGIVETLDTDSGFSDVDEAAGGYLIGVIE